jgi:hypothetical protein
MCDCSSDASKLESEKVYLNKLNMILVQVLKQEWPQNWPSFISGNKLNLPCAHIPRFFRYLRCVKVERELVYQQHGDPQAALRRSFRLFGRANDPGEDPTLEKIYVDRILTSFRALYVRFGMIIFFAMLS